MKTKNVSQTPFIQACFGHETPYTPVWIMRQAGRYQAEYRAIREKYSFLELCHAPDLVSDVTCLAVDMLKVDAGIIFADILLILQSLGFDLDFKKGHGPQIHNPFRLETDLNRLIDCSIDKDFAFLHQAIVKTQQKLPQDIPLIGFAGSPFTVAAYAIEGGGSKNFAECKKLMRSQPAVFKQFLNILSQKTIEYLKLQIDAGVNAIQLFDSWIGILSEEEALEFAIPYAHTIFTELKTYAADVPQIYFGVNTAHLISAMNTAQSDVMGIDFRTNMQEVRLNNQLKAIQGNLDPTTLLCNKDSIERNVKKILDVHSQTPGFIFNLGHGILPNTPVENAKYLVDLVHRYSKSLIK